MNYEQRNAIYKKHGLKFVARTAGLTTRETVQQSTLDGIITDALAGIGEPEARETENDNDGVTVVIQMAKRSEQLNSIADIIEELTPNSGLTPVSLTVEQARRLWGMAQTLGKIANELKSVGK